jgi:NADPH-dependent ferric siderophore reductase
MRRPLILSSYVLLLAALVVAITSAVAGARRTGLPLPLHTRVTVSGQTLGSLSGRHVTGHVFVTAQWNSGNRYVVAAPRTDAAGRWTINFRPSHRGDYTMRIVTPDAGVLEYAFVVH